MFYRHHFTDWSVGGPQCGGRLLLYLLVPKWQRSDGEVQQGADEYENTNLYEKRHPPHSV